MVQRLPEVNDDIAAEDSSISNVISRLLPCNTGSDDSTCNSDGDRFSLGISLPSQTSELTIDGSGVKERHRGVQISPTPGFVVKSISSSLQKKIFINVCSNNAIAQPQMKVRLDNDGKEVEGLNVPIAVGPTRICKDHAGATSVAVDCIVHPSVIEKVDHDSKGEYRDFICQLVIRCVEQKIPNVASVDTKYRLPRLKYQGYVDSLNGDVVPQHHSNAVVASQWVRDIRSQPKIEEVKQTPQSGSSASAENMSNCSTSRIPMDLYVELQDKTIHPILGFIQQRFTFKERNDKYSPLDCFNPIPVLAKLPENSEERLHQSQLLLEPFIAEPPDDIEHMIIHVHLTSATVTSAQIQLSAGICKVSADGFITTSCVIPFWINPKTASCSNGGGISSGLLTIRALLCRNSPMYDAPDPGSQPWMLVEALGHGKSRSKVSAPRGSFIGPMMPQDAKGLCTQNTVEEAIADEKTEFAEDKFHANDVESQYMLELQFDRKDKRSVDIDRTETRKEYEKIPCPQACSNEDSRIKSTENAIKGDFTIPCPILEAAFPNVFGNDLWSRLLIDSQT